MILCVCVCVCVCWGGGGVWEIFNCHELTFFGNNKERQFVVYSIDTLRVVYFIKL